MLIHYALVLGYGVAHSVEALRFKSEGRGFDSRWYHWCNPSGHTLAVVHLASNINKYQEYLLGRGSECIGLTTLPPSGSLNFLQPSGTVQACIVLDTFMHYGWMEIWHVEGQLGDQNVNRRLVLKVDVIILDLGMWSGQCWPTMSMERHIP